MRIDRQQNTISFKRALTPSEEKSYAKVLQQAKEVVGQTGHSILIMPTSSLPQTAEFNSGVGNLSSGITGDYLKYMQTYYGFNVIEDLPAGQIHWPNGYMGSSLDLGVHQINPELLITDKFEHLLTRKDLQEISDSNTVPTRYDYANFRNVVDKGSSTDKALEKAYAKFLELPETSKLKIKYNQFVTENADWLQFPRSHEPNQEFFKFKQFLAEEHLKIGKAQANALNYKVCGDCMIGFSEDEIKAFPQAFYSDKNIQIGDWKATALNYDEITKPSSDAYKLLKRKIQLAAKRYDMIRMDVGWSYITPKLTTLSGNAIYKNMDNSLISLVEQWVKEVKGPFFDTKNILYEVEAGANDFKAYTDANTLISPLKQCMKIYTSQFMHDNGWYDRWGYTQAFAEKKLSPDEYVLGVGNHDSQPLKQMALGIENIYAPPGNTDHKTSAIKVLSRIFGISEQVLADPAEFSKAKYAEPMMTKHNMVFFADLFGIKEAFNKHKDNLTITPERNFAIKVPANFKDKLHSAIQSGHGFNPMDALEKIFIAKGYNKTHTALFHKIIHFKNILESTSENAFRLTKTKIISFGALGGLVGILGAIMYFKKPNNTEIVKEYTPQKIQSDVYHKVAMNDFLSQKA